MKSGPGRIYIAYSLAAELRKQPEERVVAKCCRFGRSEVQEEQQQCQNTWFALLKTSSSFSHS